MHRQEMKSSKEMNTQNPKPKIDAQVSGNKMLSHTDYLKIEDPKVNDRSQSEGHKGRTN